MIKTIATTGTLASLLVAGSVSAQSTPGEETFYDLNQAFAAAMRCTDREFSREDHNVIQQYIAEAAGEPIGAGTRLQLIKDAKARVHKLTLAKGCSQEEVAGSLALYESELAGLL